MILPEEHVGLARHVLARLYRNYDEDDLGAAFAALVEAARDWNSDRRPPNVGWPTYAANRIRWSRLAAWRTPAAKARRLEVALFLSSPYDEEAEIERPEMGRADTDLARTEARVDVENLLAGLPEKQADILRRRYGIETEAATLAEIGEDLKIGKERVRQLEQQALAALRRRAARPSRFQKSAPEYGRRRAFEAGEVSRGAVRRRIGP